VVGAVDFSIITRHLYKRRSTKILHQYVPEFERPSILAEAHGGVVLGHYAGRVTAQKILCVGLWWPMVCKDEI